MKARIKPLGEKKYYGTYVAIEGEGWETSVQVWERGDTPEEWAPSERELMGYPFTTQDWLDNKPVTDVDPWDDGKNVVTDGARYFYEISDNHYECAKTLKIAQQIVDAINSAERSEDPNND